MNPLWELTKTRLREFVREPGAVFWVFGFPLLMAIGLGLAFRNQPAKLPVVAVVETGSAATTTALLNSDRLAAMAMPRAAAQHALRTGKVDMVVELDNGTPGLRYDPTREVSTFARLVVDDVLERAAGREDRVSFKEHTDIEAGGRYIDFLLPGLIGLNLMGSSMWGVGYNLVVARKRRLLRRYAVTPMRRSHFLLSYFFSRSLFLLAELLVLLGFGALFFDTIVQGSYLSLVAVAVAGAASFAAISLLIGARVENTESANGWMNFVQLPMWVLSGAFFSYERFPEWLHEPIRWLPLTALVDGLRAVFNDGATLTGCWHQLIVLCAWGLAGFFVSLRTFRWQ
jgi:ABC-type multidrug transport system permease subunit